MDYTIVGLFDLAIYLRTALVENEGVSSFLPNIAQFHIFDPFFPLKMGDCCPRVVHPSISIAPLKSLLDMFPFLCFLCLLNSLFKHFPLDYCLQSIRLYLVIESLFQIRAISLLQHSQIAFELV